MNLNGIEPVDGPFNEFKTEAERAQIAPAMTVMVRLLLLQGRVDPLHKFDRFVQSVEEA